MPTGKNMHLPKNRSLLSGLFHVFSLVLLFTMTLLFPSSSSAISQESDQAPVKICAVFSETGIAASHNQPLIEMTRLAIKTINDRGGLLGKPVELILFDNLSTPIGSAIAARRCALQEVTAVVGALWSSHSLAMAPILQEAGIPMISPGSTNPDVTKGKDYIFRACFIDSFQGLAMAKFAQTELRAKTAVVATNIDEDYSTMLGKYFSQAFEKNGGRILEEISYRGTATDFSTNIKTLRKLKPDVVYLPGYTRDSGLFIKQSIKMGITATFLGGDAWDEIEPIAGTAIEGSFESTPWHPGVPFPASAQLKQLFTATYGTDISSNLSPLAYDAVMILADAITRAGTTEHKAIRDALAATTNFQGATGAITFDGNGDPQSKPIIIIEFQKGKRVFRQAMQP